MGCSDVSRNFSCGEFVSFNKGVKGNDYPRGFHSMLSQKISENYTKMKHFHAF